MGNSSSGALTQKEVDDLVQQTQFSMAKIYELHEHFSAISGSISKDGLIDKAEFNKALGMKDSLFVDRVFTLFDKNSDGNINFREFLTGLSVFCPSASHAEKLRFSFDIYDKNKDGAIAKSELQEMLESTLVESSSGLSKQQVASLIDATFLEADANGDGEISFDEFAQLVQRHPSMLKNMTIASLQ